ncbi:hypothetical protein BH09ACT11_BH09ACT11_01830 [soil metagenome]
MTTAGISAPAQKLAAEAIGTFVLVLLGCGSLALTVRPNLVAVALTFGFAVLAMSYALGRVSGGHFNPAVSLSAAVAGRLGWTDAWRYMAAQVVGGLAGALVLFVLAFGTDGFEAGMSVGANAFGSEGSGYAWWAAFLIEVVATFVLVLVVLAATDARSATAALAPMAVGLTLAGIHLVLFPLTLTSVNPARSFGPAVFSGLDSVAQLWVFIPAPLTGGFLAAVAHVKVFGHAVAPVAGSGVSFLPYEKAEVEATDERPLIIQDGWMWDYDSQEWKPAPQELLAEDAATATPSADEDNADVDNADVDNAVTPVVTEDALGPTAPPVGYQADRPDSDPDARRPL